MGKAKAMDLVLTGRMMDAAEAERSGLVARVVPADKLLDEVLAVAAKIASFSLPSVLMAKEAVNQAFETGLTEVRAAGVHATFGTEDQKEGMAAFAEKNGRPASSTADPKNGAKNAVSVPRVNLKVLTK